MAWPLTGSALTKYNRLLSDLRQYGDFIFVGAPDDITWLQETIVAASDGVLRPNLDDVANRSHFWMLELSRVLGEKVVACPECPPVTPCPPCPPCPPLTGIDWGPDSTTIDVSGVGELDISTLIAGVGITSIILRNLETMTGGDLLGNGSGGSSMESFSAPELVSAVTIDLTSNAVLSSISLPKFTTGEVFVNDCPALQSLSLPNYAASGDFEGLNSGLVNVSVPVFLPTNGGFVIFSGCALTDTSVNHLLARAVANAAFVTGTIDLSGGTNAAPTGQGIIDKATLIARGVTVSTN